jgi:hypothetical protein
MHNSNIHHSNKHHSHGSCFMNHILFFFCRRGSFSCAEPYHISIQQNITYPCLWKLKQNPAGLFVLPDDVMDLIASYLTFDDIETEQEFIERTNTELLSSMFVLYLS